MFAMEIAFPEGTSMTTRRVQKPGLLLVVAGGYLEVFPSKLHFFLSLENPFLTELLLSKPSLYFPMVSVQLFLYWP